MFADILSSNIVGYTGKEAAQGKFIILGAQFEEVAGGTSVNGLISGVEGVNYDAGEAFMKTAPPVQIPAVAGYTTLYYLNDGWYDDNGADGFKAGWCDSNGVLVDTALTPGVALWAKVAGADATINVSGAVSSDDSADVSCPATFALRSNVFPMAVGVNTEKMSSADIVGVNYDSAEAFMATAPQVQIPAAAGYTTLYYLNDGWYDDNGADGFKAGWCDSNGVLVDTVVPAAQGFWTKGVTGSFTLTFKK